MRAVLMLRALGDYTRLMLCPTTLYMERTCPDAKNYRSRDTWRGSVSSEYLSILGVVALCAFIYGAIRRGRGQRLRILGTLWFMLAYLPISNLFELNATVAEHWLYLPSVGFLIFLAGIVQDFPIRLQRVGLVCAAVFAMALSARSYARSTDWVTPKTFYQRTISGGRNQCARRGQSRFDLRERRRVCESRGCLSPRAWSYGRIIRVRATTWPKFFAAQGKRAEGEAMFTTARTEANEQRKEYPRTWVAALKLARLRHDDS